MSRGSMIGAFPEKSQRLGNLTPEAERRERIRVALLRGIENASKPRGRRRTR